MLIEGKGRKWQIQDGGLLLGILGNFVEAANDFNKFGWVYVECYLDHSAKLRV